MYMNLHSLLPFQYQFRLAKCADKYSLYDMFAFFFTDDLDFDTGKVDEKVQVNDGKDSQCFFFVH